MGTWICHLRVAEKILHNLPNLNPPAFYAGSIAPDSGIPDETWTVFNPPKQVTHYMESDDGVYRIHDLDFYRAYQSGMTHNLSSTDASFLWGYYFHLLTDVLWIKLIDPTTKMVWADLFAEDKLKAIECIKDDWYGLDHLFLRSNPNWEPWNIFNHLEFASFPINHIPHHAITSQFEYIRKYYNETRPEIDRPFPYLNETTMRRITNDSAAASLKIYTLLRDNIDLQDTGSAFCLLPPEERLPYLPPLGDI